MPKYAAILCLAALFLPAVMCADDPEPKPKAVKPREIGVAGLPTGLGSVDSPTSIPGEKKLAEVVPDRGVQAAILKQVDFRKERLLLFSWCGGVGDRLTPVSGGPGEAAFEYTPGIARDCVYHTRLFAVPIKAKVKVAQLTEGRCNGRLEFGGCNMIVTPFAFAATAVV